MISVCCGGARGTHSHRLAGRANGWLAAHEASSLVGVGLVLTSNWR